VGVSLFFASFVATWANTPALLAEAVAPANADIQACMTKPHPVGLLATRSKDGSTQVSMPVYGVGGRGFTPEERCLMKAVASITLPPLPAGVERFGFTIPIDTDDKAWTDWRDLTTVRIEPSLFAGCDRKTRTVRIVIDRRRDRTRAWLPEWQFKGAPAIKTCVTKALRKLAEQPLLPTTFGDIHFAITVE
jgi:hypothetical protein